MVEQLTIEDWVRFTANLYRTDLAIDAICVRYQEWNARRSFLMIGTLKFLTALATVEKIVLPLNPKYTYKAEFDRHVERYLKLVEAKAAFPLADFTKEEEPLVHEIRKIMLIAILIEKEFLK